MSDNELEVVFRTLCKSTNGMSSSGRIESVVNFYDVLPAVRTFIYKKIYKYIYIYRYTLASLSGQIFKRAAVVSRLHNILYVFVLKFKI